MDVAPEELDPGIVLWAICRTMDPTRLPQQRVVVRIDLRDLPQKFWLLVQRPRAEVCRKHPGFDEDLVLTTSSEWLAKWHMGMVSLREAVSRSLIEFDGPAALERAFSTWGGQSPFANIRRPRPQAAG